MQLIILTPGIKRAEFVQRKIVSTYPSPAFFLCNPLHQKAFCRQLFPNGKFLTDDDFITQEKTNILVADAKNLAWNWFSRMGHSERFFYNGIDLRCLFTQDLAVYFVKALRITYLLDTILAQNCFEKLVIVDDGSEWGKLSERIGSQRQIPIVRHSAAISKSRSLKKTAKSYFKVLFRLLFRPNIEQIKPNGILYSSALRFAIPFLAKSEGSYYLRDTFSLKAKKMSRLFGFAHITPECFPNMLHEASSKHQTVEMLAEINAFFSEESFFSFEGLDLWPLIRHDFEKITRSFFFAGMELIDRFDKMLARLTPRAILVDEEVCFFNKTLIQVANVRNIPTFCLVHGVPLESIGSIPSHANYVLAWGRPSKERLCGWGIQESKILEVGAPQFGSFNEKARMSCRKSIFRDLKISEDATLLLLTAFPFQTNEDAVFLNTTIGSQFQTAALLLAFAALREYPNLQLIVKFHPYDQNSSFSASIIKTLAPDLKDRIRLLLQYDASSLIRASDLVLSVASTMYFEALTLGTLVCLLDFKNNRLGDFLSHDYMDLENPASCLPVLRRYLDPDQRDHVLISQSSEIKRHFYHENKDAIETVWELLCGASKNVT